MAHHGNPPPDVSSSLGSCATVRSTVGVSWDVADGFLVGSDVGVAIISGEGVGDIAASGVGAGNLVRQTFLGINPARSILRPISGPISIFAALQR